MDTPAHINRLAWAWLQEFLRDLRDDWANRLAFQDCSHRTEKKT
jgi:hypothetical protein